MSEEFEFDYNYDPWLLPGDGEWGCTACPVEAMGRLSNGRPWYFRARAGGWSVILAPSGAADAYGGPDVTQLAAGDDPWFGYMPPKDAAAIIKATLGTYEHHERMLSLTGQRRDPDTGAVTEVA